MHGPKSSPNVEPVAESLASVATTAGMKDIVMGCLHYRGTSAEARNFPGKQGDTCPEICAGLTWIYFL